MHATDSTTLSHTGSRNPHAPTTTQPNSHTDKPAMHALDTLALDSVTCIYSYSTHAVTQLALRPAHDESSPPSSSSLERVPAELTRRHSLPRCRVDRDALEVLYEQVKEEVAVRPSLHLATRPPRSN